MESAQNYLIDKCPIPNFTVSIPSASSSGAEDIDVVAIDTANDVNMEISGFSLLAEYSKANSVSNEHIIGAPPQAIMVESEQYERYPMVAHDKRSPINFWRDLQATELLPILSKAALDVLSVLASSVSVERLLSAAGRAKNDTRSRLRASAIENECIIRLNRFALDDADISL